MMPDENDSNFLFSFVWKTPQDVCIDFWMTRESGAYHCFYRTNDETFHCFGTNGAELLDDALRLAGLSEAEADKILVRIKCEMGKGLH